MLDSENAPSLSMRIADLDVEVNDIAGVLNVQYGRLVDTAIALLDDDRLWFGSGMTTVANWLVWRAGVSPSTALAVVKVAERSSDLPETVAALRRGELSLDQAASIARKAPSWCDEQARDYGRLMTVPQLRTVLGSYPYPVLEGDGREIQNPDPAEEPGPEETPDAGDVSADTTSAQSDVVAHDSLQDEWCSITVDDDGMYRLSAGLHPGTATSSTTPSTQPTIACSTMEARMSTLSTHCASWLSSRSTPKPISGAGRDSPPRSISMSPVAE